MIIRRVSVDEALRSFHEPQPLPPPAVDERYGFKAVVDATGVTARMLQWWDEKGIVSPEIVKWKRRYTFGQALRCRVIWCLASKNLSLRRAEKALSAMADERGSDWLDLARSVDAHDVLLVDINGEAMMVRPGEVLDRMVSWLEPMIAVDVSGEAKALAAKLGGGR